MSCFPHVLLLLCAIRNLLTLEVIGLCGCCLNLKFEVFSKSYFNFDCM